MELNIFCTAYIIWGTGFPRRIIINEGIGSKVEQIYKIYEIPEGFIAAQPAMCG
jgi:hypothetical protein